MPERLPHFFTISIIITSYRILKLKVISHRCHVTFKEAQLAVGEYKLEKEKPWMNWDETWLKKKFAEIKRVEEASKALSDWLRKGALLYDKDPLSRFR